MDVISISSQIINMSYDELVITGQKAAAEVFCAVSRISKETEIKLPDPYHTAAVFLVALTATVTVSDGTYTSLEKNYIHDVIKLPPEEFIRELQDDFKDVKEYISPILSNMTYSEKESVATVILTLAAVDNRITSAELECLNKILG